ncbi:hypothetical protein RJZ56_001320 [Blastomyces dermatitidis]|uniref:Uncharacterized protein n=1 Tax=Ajellomyces dermatitidis (strain ER-3 / ATCC MYA-2586) TaxID=559297 RepID=A0ABX2W0G5_AJEDR|nr:uncharacterized protein BDCG_17815 [Blastomyces dermatitidis ER-3]OAT02876.1 hypothetical protein BDCG_17815 [Blastomyces dermatitidis ER-3]
MSKLNLLMVIHIAAADWLGRSRAFFHNNSTLSLLEKTSSFLYWWVCANTTIPHAFPQINLGTRQGSAELIAIDTSQATVVISSGPSTARTTKLADDLLVNMPTYFGS